MTFDDTIDALDRSLVASATRPLTLALTLPLLSLVAAHIGFTPVHRLNDDTGMDLLARGVTLASEPTPFILFSNVLYGRLLNSLYESMPGLPWYRLGTLVIQYATSAAVIWSLMRRGGSLGRWAGVIVYLLVFDLHFYVSANFTIGASMAAVAAIAVWLSTLDDPRYSGAGPLVASFALLVTSFVIRYDAAAMMMLLAVPPCGIVWMQHVRSSGWRRARRPALLVAVPLAACLVGQGLHLYDRTQYAEQGGWEEFHAVHDIAAEFIDFERVSYTPETRPLFDAVGWSRNDFMMLMNWFYLDTELFEVRTMTRVAEAFPPHRLARPELLRAHLSRTIDDPDLATMLGGLACIALFCGARRGNRVAIAGTLLAMSGIVVFLVVYLNRFPPRVYQPLLAGLAVLWIALDARRPALARRSLRRTALAVACLVLVLAAGTIVRLSHQTARVAAKNGALRHAMEQLDPDSGDLYVVWGSEFPYESILPLESLDYLESFEVFSLGADTRSPVNLGRLAERRIPDLHRAIYRRDDVYVISNPYQNDLFTRYVLEHHRVRVRPESVSSFRYGAGRLFDVYRFRELTAASGLPR